jgi:hypothetical protein
VGLRDLGLVLFVMENHWQIVSREVMGSDVPLRRELEVQW